LLTLVTDRFPMLQPHQMENPVQHFQHRKIFSTTDFSTLHTGQRSYMLRPTNLRQSSYIVSCSQTRVFVSYMPTPSSRRPRLRATNSSPQTIGPS
jgi:hypothetical protein